MTIKEARLAAGLTQQGMSDMLGIPKRTIQDWEGDRRIPPEWVERLVIKELVEYNEERMNNMKYRIYNADANIVYDDVYDTVAEAEETIKHYEEEDLRYIKNGEMPESYAGEYYVIDEQRADDIQHNLHLI